MSSPNVLVIIESPLSADDSERIKDAIADAYEQGRASIAAPLRLYLSSLFDSDSRHLRPVASRLRAILEGRV